MMELRLCRFNLHQPRPGRTVWDEETFTYNGECRHCGEAIASKSPRRWTKIAAPVEPEIEPVEYLA